MKSDTPEYDAVYLKWSHDISNSGYYEDLEPLCQKLERERNELRDKVVYLASKLIDTMNKFVDECSKNWDKIGKTKGEPEFFNSPKFGPALPFEPLNLNLNL